MIIHRFQDGSEGYEYQVGDKVIVERTIPGGWFDTGPKQSNNCVVSWVNPNDSWTIAELHIRFSENWGPVSCFPWMIDPTQDTKQKSQVIMVPGED